MAGYIKLYRQMTEWEWYKDIPVRVLFEHCLLRANHKDKKWQGKIIKAGSFVTSYENLSIETGLTYKQVRTALDKLKRTGEVAHEGHTQYSIISIKNWDKFQVEGSQEGSQRADEGQTKGRQRATNKNDKNDKNDKNEKNVINSEKKFLDPFVTNPLIRFFKDEYFRIFNCKPYLTAIERNKLCELSSDIEDFKETIPIVLEKMKHIDFGFDNWKPTASWLLKENNYTTVLNGTYDKQESKEDEIFRRLRERNLNGQA